MKHLGRVDRGRDTEAEKQADLTRDAHSKAELFRRDCVPAGSLDARPDAKLGRGEPAGSSRQFPVARVARELA